MSKYDIVISCASWEDRFTGSIHHHDSMNEVENYLLFCVSEFADSCRENLSSIESITNKKLIDGIIHYISTENDVATWKYIEQLFLNNMLIKKRILIDVSTMPRYLIWYVLHFLKMKNNHVEYCYFRPDRYEECEWLTEEPLSPRLVFKHSGLYLPNMKTILVIQSGFDIERVHQLIYTYEPEKLFLAVQEGEQLNNISKNIKQHRERLNYQDVEYFPIDAFSNDHGYSKIENIIVPYIKKKNIVMASFGPKLLAVEMFKINMKYPEIGLVDVPVRKYNETYSHGTDYTHIQKGKL